jgi:hypothetical protein
MSPTRNSELEVETGSMSGEKGHPEYPEHPDLSDLEEEEESEVRETEDDLEDAIARLMVRKETLSKLKKTKTKKVQNALPRLGGVSDGEVWCGGTVGKPISCPTTVNAYRSSTLSTKMKTDTKCRTGLPEAEVLKMEKAEGNIPILQWIERLKVEIENTGQEGVFSIPFMDMTGSKDVFDDFSITIEEISREVNNIKLGRLNADVTRDPICKYDIENLNT